MSAEQVSGWIASASRGVVFTGAGISTESGIPDFRGPGGFWERKDQTKYTIQNYVRDPSRRQEQWRASLQARESAAGRAPLPNAGHTAIARLEKLGLVRGVITQNVDGLHHSAGSENVLELHGTTRLIGCLECGTTWPPDEILDRVATGEDDPRCERCGGILKRATISFGQNLPVDALREGHRWSLESDVFLVVGSSLVVYPAAAMPEAAVDAGAKLVIINREPTPLDSMADLVLRTEAGPTLTQIVAGAEAMMGAG